MCASVLMMLQGISLHYNWFLVRISPTSKRTATIGCGSYKQFQVMILRYFSLSNR